MVSREGIESFLIQTELDFEEVEEGMWIVHPQKSEEGASPVVVVSYAPPVVVLRSDLRRAPEDDSAALGLYRKLLELNATDLIHGAYGLEDGKVILTDTLELEDLDFSEFRASLESIALAVTSHLPHLTTD
ncbi:MAG: CesT family type III secretion system chaperone [Gemmatimonadota bacterium]